MIETWKAWVMLAFGMLIGTVVTYIFPWPIWFKPSPKDWIEAVSALGTLAAVVVALALGLSDAWRRSVERREVASVMRWIVGPELERLRRTFTNIARQLDVIEDNPFNTSVAKERSDALRRIYPKLVMPLTTANLDKLRYFPHGHAQRMAFVLGSLAQIEMQCEDAIFDSDEPHDFVTQARIVNTTLFHCDEAIRFLLSGKH